MSDKRYSGWTNYETWRVNLEVFDGADPGVYASGDIEALATELKDTVEGLIDNDTVDNSLGRSYAMAFISDVNWREIAEKLCRDSEVSV